MVKRPVVKRRGLIAAAMGTVLAAPHVARAGLAGADFFNPAAHLPIRGNGDAAWSGWAVSPRLEALRGDWFAAPDLATQQKIARQMQLQAWPDVPYIPLGQIFRATSFSTTLTGIPLGFRCFMA